MTPIPVSVVRELHPAYRARSSGEFHLGDVRALLPELEEAYAGQIKMFYLDPPYQTGDRFEMRVRVGERDWRSGKGSLTLPAYRDDLSREAHMDMMRRVLVGCRNMLREDGMLFLHVDYRTSARMRLLLDEIFGEGNFLNEIIWVYRTGGRSRKYFSRKHDTIYFYRKGPRQDFNLDEVLVKPEAPRENHMRRHVDPDGRVYRSMKSGDKVYTYYDDEPVPPTDVWTDLSHLQQRDPERTGYDTQKPLSLLNRIVRAGSRRGEWVGDLFCGSGTTLEAASINGRRFLGVDQSPLVPAILRRRLRSADYAMELSAPPTRARCDLTLADGVGFYHVELKDFAPAEGTLPGGLTGLDAVDSWAAGYLEDGAFRCLAEAQRSPRHPALTDRLEVPVFAGEAAVALYDVAGGRHYYRLGG